MTKHLKPYKLVWVRQPSDSAEGGSYGYFGQVMSLPTPTRTIMVRRVPGHPGTLGEVSLDQIRPVEGHEKPRYVHYATVAGSGQFPVDMLRYDSCVPVNFTLVEDSWGRHTKTEIDPSFGFEGLVVARASSRRYPHWTVGRWSSFLWGIKELKTEKIMEGE